MVNVLNLPAENISRGGDLSFMLHIVWGNIGPDICLNGSRMKDFLLLIGETLKDHTVL